MKKHFWTIFYGVALTAFTVYISLDTFVLSDTYQANATEENTAMFENLTEGGAESSMDIAQDSGDQEESGDTQEESKDDQESKADQEEAGESTEDASEHHSKGRGHRPDRSSDSEDDSSGVSGHSGGRSKRSGKPENSDGSSSSEASDGSDNAGSSSSGSTAKSGSSSSTGTVSTGSQVYENDNAKITLTEYYENNTKIYVADVQLTSARYLKTAFADDTYGKNVTDTTSSIASSNDAILAINGDYYGVQETGYVIRNGIVYRNTSNGSDVLCIYADGTFQIVDPDEKTAEELVEEGVWQAFSFGPGLVENGETVVSQNEEVGKAMASNPRTAIGIIDANHYVFVVSDGRTSESEGLSLYQLAQFMQELGVETAYNLDGGGSSTMYFNGEVINNPTTTGNSIKERGVSDIVYIGA